MTLIKIVEENNSVARINTSVGENKRISLIYVEDSDSIVLRKAMIVIMVLTIQKTWIGLTK